MTAPYTIFKTFDENRDIVTIRGNEVTTGLWTGDTGSLSAVYTSSAQKGVSGEFYYDIYDADPTSAGSTAEIQFAVTYGHISGGASPSLALKNDSKLPTQVIYSQYKNMLLGNTAERFTFGLAGGTTRQPDDFYAINIQRSRLRQALDPGNWELSLSGSRGVLTFIDDSGLKLATAGNLTVNNVYNVRSGSLTNGVSGTTAYGLVFPDFGVILLDAQFVSSSVGFINAAYSATSYPVAASTASTAVYTYPHEAIFRSLKGAIDLGFNFQARSAEAITTENYFVRVFNNEFNQTNNPTILSSSLGTNRGTVLEAFQTYPKTYITTVGLYNDNNDLLAVAKLSRPLEKGLDKEASIRVRLDY